MKGLSYTQRTLRYLREQGVICEIVERFNPYAGKFGTRHDLFGFIDIICLWPVLGFVGVQSTSGACHSQHRRKITEDCANELMEWIKYGGKVKLISWKKRKLRREGKAMRWMPRVEDITI